MNSGPLQYVVYIILGIALDMLALPLFFILYKPLRWLAGTKDERIGGEALAHRTPLLFGILIYQYVLICLWALFCLRLFTWHPRSRLVPYIGLPAAAAPRSVLKSPAATGLSRLCGLAAYAGFWLAPQLKVAPGPILIVLLPLFCALSMTFVPFDAASRAQPKPENP